YAGEDEDRYATKVIDALTPLEADPRSVLISSEYFHYADELGVRETLTSSPDIPRVLEAQHGRRAKLSAAAFTATLEITKTHLSLIREFIHSVPRPIDDIL